MPSTQTMKHTDHNDPSDELSDTPAPGGRSLASLSMDELRNELQRRSRELDRLTARRDRLLTELAEIDHEIGNLGGSGGGQPGRSGGSGAPRRSGGPRAPRASNEVSLPDAIALAVEVHATITPSEAAEMVLKNGYRSNAKNFKMMVANALAKDERFKRLARGQYERVG
ncbi:MAG: hypothetical protein ACT4PU_05325 [Planctomycetota bacterium]